MCLTVCTGGQLRGGSLAVVVLSFGPSRFVLRQGSVHYVSDRMHGRAIRDFGLVRICPSFGFARFAFAEAVCQNFQNARTILFGRFIIMK